MRGQFRCKAAHRIRTSIPETISLSQAIHEQNAAWGCSLIISTLQMKSRLEKQSISAKIIPWDHTAQIKLKLPGPTAWAFDTLLQGQATRKRALLGHRVASRSWSPVLCIRSWLRKRLTRCYWGLSAQTGKGKGAMGYERRQKIGSRCKV